MDVEGVGGGGWGGGGGGVKKNLHTVWKGKLENSRRLLVETLLCGSLAVT